MNVEKSSLTSFSSLTSESLATKIPVGPATEITLTTESHQPKRQDLKTPTSGVPRKQPIHTPWGDDPRKPVPACAPLSNIRQSSKTICYLRKASEYERQT